MWFPSILRQSFRVIYSHVENKNLYIGTHNGKFHCDEVFACWMLKSLPEFSNHLILRTREPEDLEKCEVVVDVGGVFNHDKKRYDHHQRGFAETMESLCIIIEKDKLTRNKKPLPYKTKLSSAGLVYAFYGKDVILRILEKDGILSIEESELDFYYDILYKEFVEAVDAVDNGIKAHNDESKYVIPVSLQSLVEDLNPAWNDKDVSEDARFMEAMQLVGKLFSQKVLYMHKSWMPCRQIVEKALLNRINTHKSGQVMLLPESCPWKKHFFMLEKAMCIAGQVIYVVYPSDTNNSSWRVQAVPLSEGSEFENRCPLPEAWRGKRNEELSEVAGIQDCIFVHASGFIGGAKAQNNAVEMAIRSLKIAKIYNKSS